MRDVLASLSEPVSVEAFASIQKRLIENHLLEAAGSSLLRIPGFAAGFSATDRALWDKILATVRKRGQLPFTLPDLSKEVHVSEVIVRALMFRRRANGDVWRVTPDLFLAREQLATLARLAEQIDSESAGLGFTAAQFRNVSGIGRNMVIRLLEFFDAAGLTSRRGDMRRMRPGYEAILAATPAD